jgi:hypothetical protein
MTKSPKSGLIKSKVKARKGSKGSAEAPTKLKASTLEDVCNFCLVSFGWRLKFPMPTLLPDTAADVVTAAFAAIVVHGKREYLLRFMSMMKDMGFEFQEQRDREGYSLIYPVSELEID